MRRFFCENCGGEVQESDDLCPHCGAIFTAIKCPQCGYRGKLHQFHGGCPACGFLGENKVQSTVGEYGGTGRGRRAETTYTFWQRVFRRTGKKTPAWLFWLILVFMVVAFVLLSVVYMRIA